MALAMAKIRLPLWTFVRHRVFKRRKYLRFIANGHNMIYNAACPIHLQNPVPVLEIGLWANSDPQTLEPSGGIRPTPSRSGRDPVILHRNNDNIIKVTNPTLPALTIFRLSLILAMFLGIGQSLSWWAPSQLKQVGPRRAGGGLAAFRTSLDKIWEACGKRGCMFLKYNVWWWSLKCLVQYRNVNKTMDTYKI